MHPVPRDLAAFSAAYRAAGYAVIGRLVGLQVREAILHQDLGDRYKGLCFFKPRAPGEDRTERVAALCAVAHGGTTAEFWFRESVGWSLTRDYTQAAARSMLRLLKTSVLDPDQWMPFVQSAQKRSNDLFGKTRAAVEVIRLACVLVVNVAYDVPARLTGGEVEELLAADTIR